MVVKFFTFKILNINHEKLLINNFISACLAFNVTLQKTESDSNMYTHLVVLTAFDLNSYLFLYILHIFIFTMH